MGEDGFSYRPNVLDQLSQHGVQPGANTRPEIAHAFVSDLYRYEIRRLRDRLLRKEFPKPEYYARVVELRLRYRVIAVRPAEWLTARNENP